MPIVSARDLYKFHDQGGERIPILRSVDLEVEEGSCLTCIAVPASDIELDA